MSIAKPFTFVANTYAKASEVNADFDTVYAQVNTNISAIAQNATDIDNLENNKANINGDYSQRFAVANPTTNTDAVNKQYLIGAIGNSINYINGLIITKDSGSPEDTIIVSAGSCYDSTKSVVLSLSDATSKQNDNQGASTTYYVYIIGDATGATIDILISSNSTTPSLPSGYTLYRQIGNYTTDSSSNIQIISNYSNSMTFSLNSVMPNYTSKTSVSTNYLVTSDCFISGYGIQRYNGSLSMTINGTVVWQTGGGLDASQGTTWLSNPFLVRAGDSVQMSGSGSDTYRLYKYNIAG